jgi:hypothetical protein
MVRKGKTTMHIMMNALPTTYKNFIESIIGEEDWPTYNNLVGKLCTKSNVKNQSLERTLMKHFY